MKDYLFDSSSEENDEVKKLEHVLGELRFKPRALDLDAQLRVVETPPRATTFLYRYLNSHLTTPRLAASLAVVMVAIAGVWFTWFAPRRQQTISVADSLGAQRSVLPEQLQAGGMPTPVITSSEVVQTNASPPNDMARHNVSISSRKKSSVPRQSRPQTRTTGAPMIRREHTPRPAHAAQAAEDLLLALNVTNSTLDKTQKQIRSRLTEIRLPSFSNATSR